MNAEFVEKLNLRPNAIFLRLRSKLGDFDQTAGWEPVYAYNFQPLLLDLMLLTDCMFP